MKINEKTGLYDNYGLWHVPFWQTYKFQLLAKITICLVIVGIIVYIVKKYRAYCKRKKLSLWDQALHDLTVLKKEMNLSAEHNKEFYVKVSALLKKYFHERFGYDVIGKTDDEFIHFLQKYHDDQHSVEELKSLLYSSGIVKFAKAYAQQEQIDKDYVCVIAVIKKTIPLKNNEEKILFNINRKPHDF